jgi:hypothetical protein
LLTNNPDKVAALRTLPHSCGRARAARLSLQPSHELRLRTKANGSGSSDEKQRKLKIAHPSWRRTLSSLNDIKYLWENTVTWPNNGILSRNNGFSASAVARNSVDMAKINEKSANR